MDNAVVILTSVNATNIDAKVRSFISEEDIQNGVVFKAGAYSTETGEEEVRKVVKATENQKGLYMAFSQEDTIVEIGGNKYKYGNIDPRLFTNKAGYTLSGFRLEAGDLVTIAGGILGDGNTYVKVNADGKLEYCADAPAEGTYFEALKNTYIIAAGAGGGAIGGSHRLAAVELEVVEN